MLFQLSRNGGRIDDDAYRNHGIIPNVCQTFSLGILILSLASLTQSEIFYDFHRMSVNFEIISFAMQRSFALGYSKLLTNLIKATLSSYKDRPLPSQIFKWI